MFSLFGRKPPKRPEQLFPELKRHLAQIRETTGVSDLAIASATLSSGISLLAKDEGIAGLAAAIETLGSLIEDEKQTHGSLGSSILNTKIRIPEHPNDHFAIEQIKNCATYFIKQGYSAVAVGAAMVGIAGDIARLLDKHNVLPLMLFRNEYIDRCLQFRRERLRHTVAGECTEESINILLQAESDGFILTVEQDRTFVLARDDFGSRYLRSNVEIERFGREIKSRREAAEANRSPVERLVERGHKHLKEQELENAIGAYSAALRINPDDAELYFHRAVAWSNTYHNRGKKPDDLRKAIDDYTRAIEINPEYGEAYFQRAGLWSDQEQEQVANTIADYSKAIEFGHEVSSSYFCRGLARQSTGEAGKAIADFDAAVRTGNGNDQFMALMVRGEAHQNLGNLELAVADFTAAEAFYAKSPPGLYTQRASALRQLGRIRDAIADLDRAIAVVSPLAGAQSIAEIYDQRAQFRTQLGELDLARQDFERAAQVKRQNR